MKFPRHVYFLLLSENMKLLNCDFVYMHVIWFRKSCLWFGGKSKKMHSVLMVATNLNRLNNISNIMFVFCPQPLVIYNNGRTPHPVVTQLCDAAGNPTAEAGIKVQLTRDIGIRVSVVYFSFWVLNYCKLTVS